MKKCKVIECDNEIGDNRTYCSLKCRNIYVNKYVRDYTKNGSGRSKKCRRQYDDKPNFCKKCGNIIPFEKRNNIFCDHSCSASYTNTQRQLSEETKKKISEGVVKSNIKFDGKRRIFICAECKKEFYNKYELKFCSKKCKNSCHQKGMSEYQKYSRNCQFDFNLKEYPNEFDFNLIERYGWYKAKNHGDNLNGVSRDHMFSIKEGFKQNINPEIIRHPANCKLMTQNDNKQKHIFCSITINELQERIKLWNEKYN